MLTKAEVLTLILIKTSPAPFEVNFTSVIGGTQANAEVVLILPAISGRNLPL